MEKEPSVTSSRDKPGRSDKIYPLVGLGQHLGEEGGRMLKIPVHDGEPLSSGLHESPDKCRAKSPFVLPVDISDFGIFPGESLENLRRFVGTVIDKKNLEVVGINPLHRLAHCLSKYYRIVAFIEGGDDDGEQESILILRQPSDISLIRNIDTQGILLP